MASKYYDSGGKEVVDGEVALAADLNTINSAIDSGFQLVVTDISAAQSDAEDWANKAEDWAVEIEDTEVEVGQYSALHWAAKASADAADTAADASATAADVVSAETAKNKAEDWATEIEDTEVEAGQYSALHHAAKASASATDTAADAISTNADASIAEEWAENPEDTAITGSPGQYSALHHAAKAASDAVDTAADLVNSGVARDKAEDWAEEVEDTEVETGQYSALHHAAKAATSAASIDLSKYPRRNLLFNILMGIKQDGVFDGASPLSAGEYYRDGWKAGSSGCTYTSSVTDGVRTVTISAGTMLQVVEGIELPGKSVVLSWTGTSMARIASGTYGTSGNVTATFPTGTNTNVEFSTGTFSLPQLEFGTVATDVQFIPYQEDFNRCRRYYQTTLGISNSYGAVIGPAITTTRVVGATFQVEMVSTPTVTIRAVNEAITSPGSVSPYNNASSTLGSWTAVGAHKYGFLYITTSNVTLTAGDFYMYKYVANARL